MKLSGQVERVLYVSEETGYSVFKIKVPGKGGLVTAVGNLPCVLPGEVLEIKGEWTNHPRFGRQFKIREHKTLMPATVEGIRRYLGSGLIKGIGPVMARRIVEKFRLQTLDVIEHNIGALQQVEGIGPKRVEMIRKAWEEQKEIRQVMIFLQAHEVSTTYAAKIFKTYGPDSIFVLKENPYRLAMDIHGIGFLTADKVAQKMGFPLDSPMRIGAGIIYVLNQAADSGHVYLPYRELLMKSRETLGVDDEILEKSLLLLEQEKRVVIERRLDEGEKTFDILLDTPVYLPQFHLSEKLISKRLSSLYRFPRRLREIKVDKAVDWVQKRLDVTLADKQADALRIVLKEKVSVITGGPGTGKTTLVRAIFEIFQQITKKIFLAAPTGRAAKRLSEATGYPASTIHRLLKYNPSEGGFRFNDRNPLDADVAILDEVSMIDVILFHHFLKALPPSCQLILVGDSDQLPPVGPGQVLRDLLDSGVVSVVALKEIFRQAKESFIIVNAHRINHGEFPLTRTKGAEKLKDFYFIENDSTEAVLDIIVQLCTERIPKRFNFDPFDDIQVLTPMHRGEVGSANLNTKLQEALNPERKSVYRRDMNFKCYDKVMQIQNNYDKEVFNGDIGRIVAIDQELQELAVDFDGRCVYYDFSDLDELTLAYAISVHKAQGSEYPAVVMPLVTPHFLLLQRNLLYTAVTRARKLVVLVGSKKALAIAVKNDRTQKRFSRLSERIKESWQASGGDFDIHAYT